MVGSLVFFVHNIISLSMAWYAANRCLELKLRRGVTFLIEAAGLAFCVAVGYLSALSPLLDAFRPYLFLAAYLGLALVLFRDKLFRKLLVMLCLFASLIVAELVTYLIWPSLSIELSSRVYHFTFLNFWWYLTYLSAEAIVQLAVYLISRRKSADVNRLPARQYWFFLFFPVSQFVLLTGYVFSIAKNISTRTSLLVAASVAVCLAADLIWLREIRRLTDNARLQAENELLGSQIEAQREYYKTLTANYADMATMRHDIANHLFTIRVLLQDGKSEEAIQYAARLEQTPTARRILSSCKNSVVHSFLEHRLQELTEKSVEASFDVVLSPVTGISDTDLIIALGNLLDNAAEACLAAQEHRIRLTMRQTDGYIQIETENTCTPGATAKKRRIAYLERGIGTSILRSLAEQYHGSYTSARDGEQNHSVLVLRENAPC